MPGALDRNRAHALFLQVLDDVACVARKRGRSAPSRGAGAREVQKWIEVVDVLALDGP